MSVRLVVDGTVFLIRQLADWEKKKWTDFPIHTSEVGGGNFPTVVLDSDSGDSSACQNTLLSVAANWLQPADRENVSSIRVRQKSVIR